MNTFFRRVKDAEFLPMSEVRKIKTILVMAFLLVITIVTIPLSFFLNYSVVLKVLIVSLFVLAYLLMIVMIRLNKLMAATQISILYCLGLTIFYTQGTGSFYAYLFFYISLTVIIFYQELYTYITYGTIVMGLGVYYIIVNQEALTIAGSVPGTMYIYIVTFVLFYFIFLAQIIYNEKLYTDMNYDWVKLNQVIDRYQDDIFFYIDEIRKQNNNELIHEDLDYQKLVSELAVFTSEQIKESGKDILNLFNLYLYLHEKGLEKILANEEISVSMKKTADHLNKYVLNRRSDMISMLINFMTRFRQTEDYTDDRYEYKLHKLSNQADEQIIALTLLYQYLASEVSGTDEWDQMERLLSADDILSLFTGPEADAFMLPSIIAFFKENRELFLNYFHNQDQGKG
ncbi:MAG: hypothetical protein GX904_04710 [Acholeplasmataceae bacterium]|nr:hypothetical protein [Acholeplasmataceae bacterium]